MIRPKMGVVYTWDDDLIGGMRDEERAARRISNVHKEVGGGWYWVYKPSLID